MKADLQVRAHQLCEELLLHEQRCMLLVESLLHQAQEQSDWQNLLGDIEEGHRRRAQQLHACILDWGGQPRSLVAAQDQPEDREPVAPTLGDLQGQLQELLDGYGRLAELMNWAGTAVRQLDDTLEHLRRFELGRR